MKKAKVQKLIGMRDIFGDEQKYLQKIYNTAKNIIDFYGFERIYTPILEQVELFEKGTGLSTDIVKKQMFAFKTKGGDSVALRPEGTPSIARAYIENGMHVLPQPIKLWYFGPFFRYERPQAGRYRQFYQIGIEVLGESDSVIDAQIIQIFYSILKELKIKNIIIEINSIGDHQCRAYYRKLLLSYLKNRESLLCSNCQRRLRENPLRILDCKEEKCQKVVKRAPQMINHLCDECKKHFKEVLEFLDNMELPYNLNPYLVRGLDYYTKTVFEMHQDIEDGKKQGALIAGGRYDKLFKSLGGKDMPACGGAIGIERIINVMKDMNISIPLFFSPKIFLAHLGVLSKRKSLELFEKFRKAKIPVAESFSKDSLRAQLKIADNLGIDYTLILGQKEIFEKEIILREMKTGKQETIKMDKIIDVIRKKLKKIT